MKTSGHFSIFESLNTCGVLALELSAKKPVFKLLPLLLAAFIGLQFGGLPAPTACWRLRTASCSRKNQVTQTASPLKCLTMQNRSRCSTKTRRAESGRRLRCLADSSAGHDSHAGEKLAERNSRREVGRNSFARIIRRGRARAWNSVFRREHRKRNQVVACGNRQ